MFEHKFEHSKVTMQCLLVGSFFAIYGSKSNQTTSGGNDLGWDFHSFSKQFCSNPNISIVYKKPKSLLSGKKKTWAANHVTMSITYYFRQQKKTN